MKPTKQNFSSARIVFEESPGRIMENLKRTKPNIPILN